MAGAKVFEKVQYMTKLATFPATVLGFLVIYPKMIGSYSNLLIKCNENSPFLRQMVTCDEIWIVYENEVRRKPWCHPSHRRPLETLKFSKGMSCSVFDGSSRV